MRAQQRLTQKIHKLAHREAKAKSAMTLLSLLDPSRGDTQTTVNCREQAITLTIRPEIVDQGASSGPNAWLG